MYAFCRYPISEHFQNGEIAKVAATRRLLLLLYLWIVDQIFIASVGYVLKYISLSCIIYRYMISTSTLKSHLLEWHGVCAYASMHAHVVYLVPICILYISVCRGVYVYVCVECVCVHMSVFMCV